MLQKVGVIKINDKKKEEFKLLEDFFSDYYKSFHEHLFPENYQLDCSESPDFIIKFDNQKIGIEITEAIKEEMMKSLDSKIEIYKIVRKYMEEENIKSVIWFSFSNKLDSDINKINKNKFIKAFIEEFKKYIMARRNKEYSSFEEFCESNKSSLICKYLEVEPIQEDYKKPLVIPTSINCIGFNYEEKLRLAINKKIEKIPLYREKVDKIYLLIKISSFPPNLVFFVDVDIQYIKEILNSYTKGENNFDKIFLYYHSDIEPQIIISD
ncbi:hypothetical protein Pmob_0629 [Petrotoga mobilis SJ95]|nr:hypothetical protein Pmob_0629 [Petrotoga mobilis SJ95]